MSQLSSFLGFDTQIICCMYKLVYIHFHPFLLIFELLRLIQDMFSLPLLFISFFGPFSDIETSHISVVMEQLQQVVSS